ncbi:glutamyl-tRNA reductase [Campylobacter pinnipediorum subsp. caledonicus]|uniref:glutamyl-tRNA reductase n=1 Tax=Campylobacter pinnipediorum TaxID=1965231 RepID=UPI000994FD7F|nr:glutamyl-tRNA reductase [Campylobacter pinnipediorum]AQW85701.1 glutamyl-tRNA reductase [Campylobacter pinnipediorum subsp. caledonicus]
MHYLSISFTHKNTDISVREKLAFNTPEKKLQILKLIKTDKDINEAMVISTCNRVEVLSFSNEPKTSSSHIIKCMAIASGVFEDELFERADVFEDSAALHHLFSVASSLDSLVVGETQIMGQIKNDFKFALENQFCGEHINKAIDYAKICAAKVRNDTQISNNPISVSSVAVAKAKEIFTTLQGKTALIIGAGEMCELAAKHLISNGAKVLILNRSSERVENLVGRLGEMADWDTILKLKEYVNKSDLIFSGTSAPNPIITDETIQPTTFHRYFFDIAVPRDIDIKNKSELIDIYSVDDLKEIVKQNLALREEQAQVAYSIVGNSTYEFLKAQKTSLSTPIIKAIRQQAKECAEKELQKAIKKGYLKNSDQEEAYKLINQVLNSFLHPMTINLKQIGETKNALDITKSMKYIFDIKEDKQQ